MTDDKKPREFTNVALLAHNSTDLRISQRALEEVNGIRDAYDALAKENERLSKMLEYEKQREYPTQSQRELAYVNEITSLRERLAEYENLPSGMRAAKLNVDNESLRESLKLAVEALEKHQNVFCCVDSPTDPIEWTDQMVSAVEASKKTLAKIKAKGEGFMIGRARYKRAKQANPSPIGGSERKKE